MGMDRPDLLKFIGRKDLNQRQLAKKLNKSAGFVNQVVAGESNVSYDTMLALVKLGINADELLGAELGEMFRKQCHEEYVTKNNIDIGVNNKTVVDGIKTVINGLNIILKQCDKAEITKQKEV